MDFVTLLILWR